jgi:hypothetical protein
LLTRRVEALSCLREAGGEGDMMRRWLIALALATVLASGGWYTFVRDTRSEDCRQMTTLASDVVRRGIYEVSTPLASSFDDRLSRTEKILAIKREVCHP